MKYIGDHPNVIKLRHHFYSYGETVHFISNLKEEEVYLNLIMDYIPETLYHLIRYFGHK